MKPPARRSFWRQLVRRCLAATLSRRLLLVAGAGTSRAICLTFDDGPHPEHTERILDILREEAVPATFFVIGRQVEQFPQIARRIVAEGHTLGHHSFNHKDPAQTSAADLISEVRETHATTGRILGRTSTLFRPPHGKVTLLKLWQLWRNGQTVVLWNVDPSDYQCQSEEELRRWFLEHPLVAGDVVLLHDSVPHAVGVLRELIHGVRSCGLSFVTPDVWLR